MAEQPRYADFDLEIERTADAGYRARVLSSPAGEAVGGFTLPFSDLELENFLLRVGRPRSSTRRLESPEMEATRQFGSRLYEAVFHDDVQLSLRRSIDESERRGEGLRIKLRLTDAPELAALPWEYLFNSSADQFLVLSRWTPIVRYLDLTQAIEPLAVTGPLRILAMISSPRDYATLDVEEEWRRIEEALSPLVERGMVAVDRTDDATLGTLSRLLRQNDYHIFHFLGHGGYDDTADDGVLVLEDGQNRSRIVPGRDLGTILRDHRSLRLAVLNACEGARSGGTDPFSGSAQSLVRQGIPAVVAMQFEITDDAAIAFAHEFYGAIADGYPVDASVAEARRAIFGLGNDIEWGTPVLYLRGDGQLFEVAADRHGAPPVGAGAATVDAEAPVTAATTVEPAAADEAVVEEGEEEAPADVVVVEADEAVVEDVEEEAPTGDTAVVAEQPVVEEGEEEAPTGDTAVVEADEAVVEDVEEEAPAGDTAVVAEQPVVEDVEEEAPTGEAVVVEAGATVVEVVDEEAPAADTVVDTAPPAAAARPRASAGPPPVPEPAVAGAAEPFLTRPFAGVPAWVWIAVALVGLIVVLLLAINAQDGDRVADETGEGITSTTDTAEESSTTNAPTTVAADVFAIDGEAAAVAAETPIQIDGSGDDWPQTAISTTDHVIYTHPDVLSGRVARAGATNESEIRLAWDADNLYVYAEVIDDVVSAPNTGNQIWRNDAVDLNISVIGGDGAVSERPDGDDFQITLTPGDPSLGVVEGSVLFVGNGTQFFDNVTDIASVAARHGGGYTLEAAIPWERIGVSDPAPGMTLGMLVAVFDNDGETVGGETLQTEITANTPGAEFQRPQTWGRLVLTADGGAG